MMKKVREEFRIGMLLVLLMNLCASPIKSADCVARREEYQRVRQVWLKVMIDSEEFI